MLQPSLNGLLLPERGLPRSGPLPHRLLEKEAQFESYDKPCTWNVKFRR